MKISDLPEGLRQIAELRTKQHRPKSYKAAVYLSGAFNWTYTPEGVDFWVNAAKSNFPKFNGCRVTNFKLK